MSDFHLTVWWKVWPFIKACQFWISMSDTWNRWCKRTEIGTGDASVLKLEQVTQSFQWHTWHMAYTTYLAWHTWHKWHKCRTFAVQFTHAVYDIWHTCPIYNACGTKMSHMQPMLYMHTFKYGVTCIPYMAYMAYALHPLHATNAAHGNTWHTM